MKRTRTIKRFGYEYKVVENTDAQYNDVMGLTQNKLTKSKILNIDKDSDNIVDKFLINNPISSLMGSKVWAMKDDNSRMFGGCVVNVYPERILLVKVNGVNMPCAFDSIISIER